MNPREAALTVLNRLEEKRFTLDRIMKDTVDKDSYFSKLDRAFINALVYGVVRNKIRIDHIINHFSSISLKKISPNILNILRIGIFQLRFLDKVPESAAVNTSVETAKKYAPPWTIKFVNAVLRNAARNKNLPSLSDIKDNISYLSIRYSFPEWLIKRRLKDFNTEETEKLLRELNSIPAITIRTNKLKTDKASSIDALSPFCEKIYTAQAPFALKLESLSVKIDEISEYKKGFFSVQDEAAQLVGIILDPKPYEKILDACAGLGGKTGHMAELMENKGHITACDNDKKKLLTLMKTAKRLGLSNIKTITLDIEKKSSFLSSEKFDKILLDAPCSGLGVIRRNPDVKWRVSEKDLKEYGKRELGMLEALSSFLKDSGIMVYSVCSTEYEETDYVLEKFLENHPEFSIKKIENDIFKTTRFYGKKYLKTYPHIDAMDGFFCVSLLKD